MSDGLTVDGWLLEALPDAFSELFDPPHPAVISAAAVKITRVLDVVTVNHFGGPSLSSHCESRRRAAAVAHRDVDDHTGDGYRRGERRYGEQQPVVGQYLDVSPPVMPVPWAGVRPCCPTARCG